MVNIQPNSVGTAALALPSSTDCRRSDAVCAQGAAEPAEPDLLFDYSITGKWDDPKVENCLPSAWVRRPETMEKPGMADRNDMKPLRVAAVQMIPTPRVDDNLAVAGRLVAEAVAQGARPVALPEYFPIMGMNETDKVACGVDGSGPIQSFRGDCGTARHLADRRFHPLAAADPAKVLNRRSSMIPSDSASPVTTRSTFPVSEGRRTLQ